MIGEILRFSNREFLTRNSGLRFTRNHKVSRIGFRVAFEGGAESYGESSDWTGFEEIENARTRCYIFGHTYRFRFSYLGIS